MSAELGDVVIYQPTGYRARLDVVDQLTTMDGTDEGEPISHLAELDLFVTDGQVLNVSALDRQVEALTAALLASEQPITDRPKPAKPQQATRTKRAPRG